MSDLPPVPLALSSSLKPLSNHSDNLSIQHQHQFDSQRSIASSSSSSTSRKTITIDTQLDVLKREMYNLRQIDLSLLAQLYALNESILEFRNMQEQDIISPQSPNSSNSEDNNIQSENDSNEDKNNNFTHDLISSDNDVIEDMHKKLEKQITKTKMNTPPPLPPTNLPKRQISRPV
ncbi:hypothetical protein PVAND_011392 [Polypedilum vanderplanki]|uniref:Uncharacterized protein n=1 Tax=Polypedilum vanderplanki TaxID=319348 RepID=A0A9J6CIG5_POLVA|nr:hypothetical protein PVAND_011392 [Polypedilum vanderplanki]